MTPDKLRRKIEMLGLQKQEFAKLIGVTRGTLYNWLTGKHRIPKAVVILIDRISKEK